MADKFEPPSGHTKSGWCPVKQRFADGIASRRLRDLHVAPRELSADGCAFLERVRSGAYTEVRKELLKKPELVLMCVPAAPAHLVAEDPQTPPQWTWSVLHEAIQKCNGSAPNDSSMETFRVLLEHCALLKINIDKTLPNSSKTWATPLHQACWRGSRPAIQGLLDAGADPFAKTCGGFLPIHNICCRRAPAYTDTTIVLWMIDRMISHHGNVEAVCTRLIDASPKEFRARNGYDNDLLLQHLATKLGTAAPLIRDQVPVISDRGPVVTYVDLDDPVRGDALFQ